MIQFHIKFEERAAKRTIAEAMRKFSDFTPEMQSTGKWLTEDARTRLRGRQSKSSIGRLGRSLTAKAFKTAVTIASVLPYARIQQEGGIVRSKRPGGYLAIPLRTKEKRNHAWPRHWAKGRLFLLKTPHGAFLAAMEKVYAMVAVTRGKNKGQERRKATDQRKLELIYRLEKQVRIPSRPYLVKSKQMMDHMRDLLRKKIRAAQR